MLRCTLAERVVEERRREAGVTDHPDYEDMVRDGFVVKDFSSFNNTQLQDLLSMVSGYNVSGPAALSLAPLCWRSAGGSPLVVVISWLAGWAGAASARCSFALLLTCRLPSSCVSLYIYEPQSADLPGLDWTLRSVTSQVRKPYLFLSFPYVCPEPVLVKSSILYINGSKRFLFSTLYSKNDPFTKTGSRQAA
jgi:hypothetical protein